MISVTNLRRRIAPRLIASLCGLALLFGCSHKSPVAPDPGVPAVFFNWLPAFLADQASAQPLHEITQWLDDDANFPRADKAAELQTLLTRLENAPDAYRQTAPGYTAADETILIAIQIQIAEARAFLNTQIQFTPMIQTLQETGEQ